MSIRLKNALQFTNVPAGATVVLPHELQLESRAVIPDVVWASPLDALLTITADAVEVSVTNGDVIPRDVVVVVERWHSYERAFGDVSTLGLSPQPFVLAAPSGALSGSQQGNTVLVDPVFGNDSTGSRQQQPFRTIAPALAAALPGDVVWVRPGVYELPAGLVLPDEVSLQGLSGEACVLRMTNVGGATTLITMGVETHLHDLTLELTSDQHVDLTGIRFPAGATTLSRIESIHLRVSNATAGPVGSSDVYGVLVDEAAAAGHHDNLHSAIVHVESAGGGTKRGVLVSAAATFVTSLADIYVTNAGGAGSFIGVETAHASATFDGVGLTIAGVDADISQTAGVLQVGGDTQLMTLSANGLGFSVRFHPSVLIWADPGALPATATRYLRPGTDQVATTPIFVRLPQGAVLKSISVRAVVASGVGASTTFTVQRNGVDTALTTVLADAALAATNAAVSVGFAAGDDVSVKVVTVGSAAQDVVCVIEAF